MPRPLHPSRFGWYLVTLRDERLIPVNDKDRRLRDTCIKVNRDHCKVGRATDLERRRRDYVRIFGADNVVFRPLAAPSDQDCDKALKTLRCVEKEILARLKKNRRRGLSRRKNEWLELITPEEVVSAVLEVLVRFGERVRLLHAVPREAKEREGSPFPPE